MLIDLHMHSNYSFDAERDTIDQIVAASIARGLAVIALTDHYEFFRRKLERGEQYDIAAMQRDTAAAREKYGDQIAILNGIELGQLHANPASRELLDTFAFDTVIGSVHAMPNDLDLYFHDYARIDCDALLRDYFAEELTMIRHGGFDVLAHLDYPLRVMKLENNTPSFENYMELITPILRELVDREIALEINAVGLFGWQKRVGPEPFVLEEYRRLGGTLISIGSDSHAAKSVGRGIEDCIAYAKTYGFSAVTVYRGRKAEQLAI